ncbi:MAG: serine/threonine protein kinase [Hyphomicrobium sp.]|nr:serine/threonine protein kinase [Hyphomicrobium sp.]
MTQLVALPDGTDLSGDYTIRRVLGAGGFGITYLADEQALSRRVSIKEYFPADFAVREASKVAHPRSKGCAEDYAWGLDRFLEEAQTLAKFNHPHIVKVHRIFRANGTAYMVLHFEEGQSLKSWLKHLGRAPRQKEIDTILAPLLDALEAIHKADFLHRDIAPDNIIIRKSGDPVLIDFGAARGELAAHSKTKTVSALVKPGYSPYEQYAESSRQQGPWTDIYALAATLYHAITGKRPPDSPSRMLKDEMVPVRDAALAGYRAGFLEAVQRGLSIAIDQRPQSVAAWRGALLAPEPEKPGVLARMRDRTEARRSASKTQRASATIPLPQSAVPPPPDVPGPAGGLLDFVDALQQPRAAVAAEVPPIAVAVAPTVAAAPNPKPVKNKKSAAPVAVAAMTPAAPIKNLPAVIAAKAATPSAGRRKFRPKPDVARTRPWARGLKTKLAIAVALTGAVVGMQDHLLRVFIPTASGITTGTIAPPSSARSVLRQTADFKAHDGAIKAMSLSGDGRLIVTLGQDNLLKVWTADSHTLQGVISVADGAATSLSVRNNRAVVSHLDGVVSVYDLESRNRLYRFKRNDATVWAATFAGSEDTIAAAGHDWTVALWQTASQTEPVALLQGHESAVQTVAVDPAGRWLVSGGADRNVKMWNLDSRDARRTFRNHSDFVSALAFAPDGQTLAAGSLDGVIRLWSVATGRVQRILNAHSARVASLAFSPDGEFIASAADDGTVRVRGLRRTRLYWSLSGTNVGSTSVGAKTVAFTNDGASLLTGGDDGVVRVWALPEPRLAQRN